MYNFSGSLNGMATHLGCLLSSNNYDRRYNWSFISCIYYIGNN